MEFAEQMDTVLCYWYLLQGNEHFDNMHYADELSYYTKALAQKIPTFLLRFITTLFVT